MHLMYKFKNIRAALLLSEHIFEIQIVVDFANIKLLLSEIDDLHLNVQCKCRYKLTCVNFQVDLLCKK